LETKYLAEFICPEFLNTPSACAELTNDSDNKDEIYKDPSFYKYLLIVVLILVVFVALFMICYRRRVKRDLSDELHS